ncbi:DUF7507 domain-containing protein [Arcanobacterium bovis]|nr:SdrD B-like domain-containing protein [Arcanobacterium bovis]
MATLTIVDQGDVKLTSSVGFDGTGHGTSSQCALSSINPSYTGLADNSPNDGYVCRYDTVGYNLDFNVAASTSEHILTIDTKDMNVGNTSEKMSFCTADGTTGMTASISGSVCTLKFPAGSSYSGTLKLNVTPPATGTTLAPVITTTVDGATPLVNMLEEVKVLDAIFPDARLRNSPDKIVTIGGQNYLEYDISVNIGDSAVRGTAPIVGNSRNFTRDRNKVAANLEVDFSMLPAGTQITAPSGWTPTATNKYGLSVSSIGSMIDAGTSNLPAFKIQIPVDPSWNGVQTWAPNISKAEFTADSSQYLVTAQNAGFAPDAGIGNPDGTASPWNMPVYSWDSYQYLPNNNYVHLTKDFSPAGVLFDHNLRVTNNATYDMIEAYPKQVTTTSRAFWDVLYLRASLYNPTGSITMTSGWHRSLAELKAAGDTNGVVAQWDSNRQPEIWQATSTGWQKYTGSYSLEYTADQPSSTATWVTDPTQISGGPRGARVVLPPQSLVGDGTDSFRVAFPLKTTTSADYSSWPAPTVGFLKADLHIALQPDGSGTATSGSDYAELDVVAPSFDLTDSLSLNGTNAATGNVAAGSSTSLFSSFSVVPQKIASPQDYRAITNVEISSCAQSVTADVNSGYVLTQKADFGPDGLACTADDVNGWIFSKTTEGTASEGQIIPIQGTFNVKVADLAPSGSSVAFKHNISVEYTSVEGQKVTQINQIARAITIPAVVSQTKTVKQSRIETGDQVDWSLAISNGTASALTDFEFIDILPYDGDARGTKTSVAFSNVRVSAPAGVKIYVTNADPRTLSENTADPMNDPSQPIWCLYGSASCPAGGKYTAIYGYIASLDAGAVQGVQISVDTPGAKANDVLMNNIGISTTPSLPQPLDKTVPVRVDVVASSIAGVLFEDFNKNGTRDSGEPLAQNVTFILQDALGHEIARKASADGTYLFDQLHSGIYRVEVADIPAGAEYTFSYPDKKFPNAVNNASVTLPVESNLTNVDFGIASTPTLSLVKEAKLNNKDSDANLGDKGETITYTFKLTNGPVPVNKLRVSKETLLVGNTTAENSGIAITCDKTSLAAYETVTCRASRDYVILQSDVEAGKINNTAQFVAESVAGSVTSNESSQSIPTDQQKGISLAKRSELHELSGTQDGKAVPGDTITYYFDVTNTGTVELRDIRVEDQLLSGVAISVTCPSNVLAPGATLTCQSVSDYRVTQADVDKGQDIHNTAVAHGTSPVFPGEDIKSDPSSTDTPTDRSSGLSLVKKALLNDVNGNQKADKGETILFEFTVRNTGALTLDPIAIDDPMLKNAGVSVTCAPSSLAAGASVVCKSGAYTVTQADVDRGLVFNEATAHGTTPNLPNDPPKDVVSNPSNTSTPTARDPKATLDKRAVLQDLDADNLADKGEKIVFYFDIRNTGNVTLEKLAVTDDMLSKVLPSAVNVTCPNVSLEPGGLATCESEPYVVTQADADAGKVANVATASGQTPAVPNFPSTSVTTPPDSTETPTDSAAKITLLKKAKLNESDGDGFGRKGDSIVFTFEVTNTGSVTLHDITIQDQFLAGRLVTAITCPQGDLPVGATITCTSAPLPVEQVDVDNGSVDNKATATGITPNGTPTISNESSTHTPMLSTTGLSLAKHAELKDGNGNQLADKGETIIYSFTIKNSGVVTISDVKVNDSMLAALPVPLAVVCDKTTLAPEETTRCEAEPYVVTQDDVDARNVHNSAVATANDPKGNPVPPSPPSTTDTPTNSEPKITLKKYAKLEDANGNALADQDEIINFEFVVENVGTMKVTKVAITDDMLAKAVNPSVVVSCPDKVLLPGEEVTCSASPYKVTKQDVERGKVYNLATADATTVPPAGTTPSPVPQTPPSTTETPTNSVAKIDLVKEAILDDEDGDAKADLGEMITYTFKVTNVGTLDISNTTIDDILLEQNNLAVKCPEVVLGVGETIECVSEPYTVTQDDVDRGEVKNIATAIGNPPPADSNNPRPPVSSPPSNTKTPTDSVAKIALEKQGVLNDVNHNGGADRHETVNYSFVVTNVGSMTVDNIWIEDKKLADEGISIHCPHGGLLPGHSVTCIADPYVVKREEVDAKRVYNIAVAKGKVVVPPPAPGLPDSISIPLFSNGTEVVSNPDDVVHPVVAPSFPEPGDPDYVPLVLDDPQGLAKTGSSLPIWMVMTAILSVLAGGCVLVVRRRRLD